MYTTSPNKPEFSNSLDMDTFGIVADLSDEVGRELAERTIQQTNSSELRNLITMADGFSKRYIVAAGRFNDKGIVGSLCDDEETVIATFQMVNSRMAEVGSNITMWICVPDACKALLEKTVANYNQKKRWPQ